MVEDSPQVDSQLDPTPLGANDSSGSTAGRRVREKRSQHGGSQHGESQHGGSRPGDAEIGQVEETSHSSFRDNYTYGWDAYRKLPWRLEATAKKKDYTDDVVLPTEPDEFIIAVWKDPDMRKTIPNVTLKMWQQGQQAQVNRPAALGTWQMQSNKNTIKLTKKISANDGFVLLVHEVPTDKSQKTDQLFQVVLGKNITSPDDVHAVGPIDAVKGICADYAAGKVKKDDLKLEKANRLKGMLAEKKTKALEQKKTPNVSRKPAVASDAVVKRPSAMDAKGEDEEEESEEEEEEGDDEEEESEEEEEEEEEDDDDDEDELPKKKRRAKHTQKTTSKKEKKESANPPMTFGQVWGTEGFETGIDGY